MPLLRTLLLNGTLGLAAYWAARYGCRIGPGMARGLAATTLAWAWATLGMEVLGSVGALSYGPLLGWSASGLVLAAILRRQAARSAGVPVEPHPGHGLGETRAWEPEAVLALGLVVWAVMLHGLTSLLGPVKVVSDGPIYHLYFAAQWWKAGRLFLIAAPFGETSVSYFPAGGDLWFTWLLAGWGGDRLAKVGQLPFLLAAALAAFAGARRIGAGPSASLIATSCFASVFPMLLFTMEPNVDTIFVAGYLLAAFFFLRYAMGDDGIGALAVGALASGGVLGTKPTGIVFGGLLLGAAGAIILLRRSSIRQALGHLLVLAVLPLVMAGYWYGRNAWITGNPLYPLHVQAFGRTWLAGWHGPAAMRLSPYYIPLRHWRALLDTLLAVFDPRLIWLWAAALAGAWSWGRGRGLDQMGRSVRAGVWSYSALAVANLAAYWVLIPYRTQQRFMLQAIGLLVVPLACLLDRARWLRVMATGLLLIHLFTAQSWPFGPSDQPPPWDLTDLVPNKVPPLITIPYLHKVSRGQSPGPDDIPATLTTLAIGSVALALAWLWSRYGRRSPAVALAGSLALVCLAVAIAFPYGEDPRLLFYPNFAPYHRGWLRLEARAGPGGVRIAYAGTNLPYYLLGVGLRNRVKYVNIDGHRGWLLHDYHRQAQRRGHPTWPTPWPVWDRLAPDYDAWLANLRAEGIELLVVASMRRPAGSVPDEDRQEFPIERRWAEAHPESFEPLYGVAEKDPKFRIYRLRPPSLAAVDA